MSIFLEGGEHDTHHCGGGARLIHHKHPFPPENFTTGMFKVVHTTSRKPSSWQEWDLA